MGKSERACVTTGAGDTTYGLHFGRLRGKAHKGHGSPRVNHLDGSRRFFDTGGAIPEKGLFSPFL